MMSVESLSLRKLQHGRLERPGLNSAALHCSVSSALHRAHNTWLGCETGSTRGPLHGLLPPVCPESEEPRLQRKCEVIWQTVSQVRSAWT